MGAAKTSSAGTNLDHRSEVENGDPVADRFDHRQIVADEKVGQIEFGLEIGQKVQNLCLHRNVEGRDRFVEDQDTGIRGKRAGDADALRLATRKLVRVAVKEVFAQVHAGEDFRDALSPFGGGHSVKPL